MTKDDAGSEARFKLSDLCVRLEVSENDARHVLNEGVFPPGAADAPGRGRHRRYDPVAAFWLAVVLRLKAVGLRVPAAAKAASGIGVAKRHARLSGEDPWLTAAAGRPGRPGRPPAPTRWMLEVGDGSFVRLRPEPPAWRRYPRTPPVTRAWVDIESGAAIDPRATDAPRPIVVVRVDLTELARLLFGRRSVRNAGLWSAVPPESETP